MQGQYRGVARNFREYWRGYGGHAALLRSPYLHVAVVLLVLTTRAWCVGPWWQQSFEVLPSLLGFTLGGFAIFLGFGDEKFRALLAEQEATDAINDYVALCATFVHFIVVQALALVAAVLGRAWWPLSAADDGALALLRALHGLIGYGLFLYALMLSVAAAMHVFRIARLYAQFANAQRCHCESKEK